MARLAPVAPDEASRLCENCGYILDGLPDSHNCPECGKAIVESIDPALRRPAAWETARGPAARARALAQTTAAVIFRPRAFFGAVTTRVSGRAAGAFAAIHWGIASLLLGWTWRLHAEWGAGLGGPDWQAGLPAAAAAAILTFVTLVLLTRLVTRLTAWEARYRGLRLPLPVIRRGMHYHAAHYLPVALLALATAGANRLLPLLLPQGFAAAREVAFVHVYIYTLCAEIVLAAVYLFETYWIAMRRMMYANV